MSLSFFICFMDRGTIIIPPSPVPCMNVGLWTWRGLGHGMCVCQNDPSVLEIEQGSRGPVLPESPLCARLWARRFPGCFHSVPTVTTKQVLLQPPCAGGEAEAQMGGRH